MIVAKAIVLIALLLIMLAVVVVFARLYFKLLRWTWRLAWRLVRRVGLWYWKYMPPGIKRWIRYNFYGWRFLLGGKRPSDDDEFWTVDEFGRDRRRPR